MKGVVSNKSVLAFLRFRSKWVIRFLCFAFVFSIGQFAITKPAEAACACGPGQCFLGDCISALNDLITTHITDLLIPTLAEFIQDLLAFEQWMIFVMMHTEFVPAMAAMTTQMNAVAMHQMLILGAFFDAEIQMETELLFQQLRIQAHKDYHPSDEMCAFGTVVRSLAATETKAQFNRAALAQHSLARQVGVLGMASAGSSQQDQESRWRQFITTYCDTDDNWLGPGTGLTLACDHDGTPGGPSGGTVANRINRDIDYARLIEDPRTLEVDFTNSGLVDDEEDVIALASNLYGHDTLARDISYGVMQREAAQDLYLALRSIAAKRAVAQDSFNAIVGMKAEGTAAVGQTREYLAAILKGLMPLGTSDEDIYSIMGENPSYYAQLEILAKKIYQDTDFYANLYDKPANVSRKLVSMKAIELMLDRAIYESQLRREMAVSVTLSSKLRSSFREAKGEGVTGSGSDD